MSTPVDKMQKWMAGILVRDLFTLSLRVKAFAYVLYDEITRPDLRLEYSRFEWYCVSL